MSKIICDICGTTYPDTAEQCPICGCVRPGDVQGVHKGTDDGKTGNSQYTYVKGGRFSKSNVKKRTKAQVTTTGVKPVVTPNAARGDTKATGEDKSKGNIVLVIVAVILTLAIIAVILKFTMNFFAPLAGTEPQGTTEGTSSTQLGTEEQDLSCTALHLDTDYIVFNALNAARVLDVTPEPANTTDVVTFASSNESVATVNADGKITSVSNGTAIITVTCGDVTAVCNVKCEAPEETEATESTEETTEPTEETTEPVETLHLNRKDITFSYEGESWMLYDGNIAKNLITWSSDNEAVVTIHEGRAVAVGYGTTRVHAEYNGEKVSCIIRCSFSSSGDSENSGVPGNGGGIGEDG